MKKKEIPLEHIYISKRIYQAWAEFAPYALDRFAAKCKMPLAAEEIPDERFRLLPDGSGEIFIKIRGDELKMAVPRDEFSLKNPENSNR